MRSASLARAAQATRFGLVVAGALFVSACADLTSPVAKTVVAAPASSTMQTVVYSSGSPGVIAYDAIVPATANPNWVTQICTQTPAVGLDASWSNPHPAYNFGTQHPWSNLMGFSAPWINAWSSLTSVGPGGQNWTRYSLQVAGNGTHVVQLLADNCSWIFLDGALVGVQGTDWANQPGRYPLQMNGTHTLDFIIFDGGGLAGGKFRLETLQSFEDNGGDPDVLPPPIVTDNTAPVIAATVTGTLGDNGWYTSDVGITWSVTDAQSAISSSTGCSATSLTSDSNGASYTCSATSTGGSASESVSIKRDAAAPSLTFSGNAGTYTVDQTVAIGCSATDAMSGVANSDCAGANGAAYTFGLGSTTLSASAVDNAGNTANASTSFTVSVTSGSLCALVQRWVNKPGVAHSMCQQLGNGAYGAFRNHVRSQSGKSVSAQNAAILIALSNAL